MKTITIFVEPKSLTTLLTTLKVLEGLPLQNDFVFTPSDIQFSEAMISNWVWLNVPIDEYLKFNYCYNTLKNK